MFKTLEELIKTIRERGEKPDLASYTKKLFDDKKLLKWKPSKDLNSLIQDMVTYELKKL